MLAPPDAELRDHRQQVDAHGREAVERLLLVRGVVGLAEHAVFDQRVQPLREDVRGDAFLGLQELAEVPLVRKHQVANDQQAPAVADDFEREVDRAQGLLLDGHRDSVGSRNCLHFRIGLRILKLLAFRDRFAQAT
ncbi:hypothetical protein D9M72_494050 [compost metagenome]